MVADKSTVDQFAFATIAARQQRLRDAIAQLAIKIAAGEVTPSEPEINALVQLCQEQFLPCEAARVWRWRPA